MNQTPDRLYELLPAVYRMRDEERGHPLRDLLRVVAEQVNVVEGDISQLYDNWFIETAQDWAVPYIADLVGYSPVNAAGDPIASTPSENRILIPRRDVANTVAYRRRRGTLSVLEDLALAVSGWPARAIEFFRHCRWTQSLNHQHSAGLRARTVSVRSVNALDQIGTPFDAFAHTIDVRRISSRVGPGRHNLPNVGVAVWRLKAYSVTHSPAYSLDGGKGSYAFSVLGNDAPLFTKPEPEPLPTHIAQETNVPAPIRRRALEADRSRFYGEHKSFVIWADWAGHSMKAPLPPEVILPADLSNWHYAPPDGFVAVDPQLGRIQFPHNQLPKRHVRVNYHYGFSGDVGGGEYDRPILQDDEGEIFQVGEASPFKRIADALAAWRQKGPQHGVIEITDSRAYVEPIQIVLKENQSLTLRAANRKRPLLRLLDWQTDGPDALTVTMGEASQFVLDGVWVAGRGLAIIGAERRLGRAICAARVEIRHSTLVPGWALDSHCKPANASKESLELRNLRAQVRISHSILGPIEIAEDEVHTDPIPVEICDSVVDAMGGEREAIIGPQGRHAHATLTFRRSTVFGIVQVHAVALGENSIFDGCVHVARRQIGCLRFSYVRPECRTPRRTSCQPDLVMTAASGAAAKSREAERVRPQVTARRYGAPAYAQLSTDVARETFEGADDGAEMGVFHDLFQPQRLANLRTRLEEFTPAGMDCGVWLAN